MQLAVQCVLITFLLLCKAQDQPVGEFYESESSLQIDLNKVWPEEGEKSKEEIGDITDVAVRNKDDFYVLHRGDHVLNEDSFTDRNVYTGDSPIRTPVILHIVKGKVNESFGDNVFFMPHSITLDKQGNLWITDIGLHQVLRYSPNDHSKPDMILGQKLTPGNDEGHFCKPTDVAVAKDGTFFVTDGYCNSRVIKFDKTGNLLKEWGSKDADDEESPYNLLVPHAIELMETKDLVAVADREHGRVVFFGAGLKSSDATGTFVDQVSLEGENSKAFGVSVNDEFGDIYVLSFYSENDPTEISVFSSNTLDFKYSIVSDETLGWAHEISSCPEGSNKTKDENCLAVASLIKDCTSLYDCYNEIGHSNSTAVFMYNIKQSSVSVVEQIN